MREARFFLRGVTFLAAITLFTFSTTQAQPVTLPGGEQVEHINFERHVMGLLSRVGCNAGACHGSFQGKGGLYLSLFGYSPEKDHVALTRYGFARRVNPANPDQSLMLLKASGQVPHGGGRLFGTRSYEYHVLRNWIAQGAKRNRGEGKIKHVEVTPAEHLFTRPGEKVQLKVMAEFDDGSKENVTAFSTFRTKDDFIAEVSRGGEVSGLNPGDTAIIVGYRGKVLTARVLVPVPATLVKTYPTVPTANYVDREIFAKLRKLRVIPSPLASDHEFLRRIHIDTIGTLPTPEEARAFLASKDPQKRVKKIEELLKHPMHSALWATKFSDITGNNIDTMENPPQLRAKRSKMWHDWFRTRLSENVPYDQIVHGILCATSREKQDPAAWSNKTVTILQQAAKSFKSDYAKRKSLDLFWRRNNFTTQQMAERIAVSLLGVRIECAQCHKHPFDRWTQSDYRSFTNVFSQVKFGISAEAKTAISQGQAQINRTVKIKGTQLREVYVDNNSLRRLNHPVTNAPLDPKALGGPVIDMNYLMLRNVDAREALYQWMIGPENPYFARSFVNRIWGHYFGVGLVDPVDDFSVANPASNDKLLDALAKDFVAHKYDIRHIERIILQSRAYQLSAKPNATNAHDRRNYSRSYVRRMMAEVMVDVLNGALGATENFGKDVPAGVRAIEVAPNRLQNASLDYVFKIFGRPPRNTTCDCERPSDPALPITLYLMTDQALLNKIANGRLKKMLAEKKMTDEQMIDEMFLATLTRLPTQREKQLALGNIGEKKAQERQKALQDVLWALINTREFILNH